MPIIIKRNRSEEPGELPELNVFMDLAEQTLEEVNKDQTEKINVNNTHSQI